MRHQRIRVIILKLLLLLTILGMFSCSGMYVAKRVASADAKLKIADGLFDKGKYEQAALEYKDFLATFAGDERCDYAQFRLAECYRMNGDYALAAIEYRILINDYGYSEYVDDAFFLEGLCIFKQAPRAERDQSKSYEALDRVNRFLNIFPNSPRKEEALRLLEEIKNKLGKKEFLNAMLYFKKNKYKSALIYFDKVIKHYAGTIWETKSHYYRGVIKESEGDLDRAIGEYNLVVSSEYDCKEKEKAKLRLGELKSNSIGGSE